MGVAILLLEHLASDNERAQSLAFNHYDDPHDAAIVASWLNLVDAIYRPLENELRNYVESQGWLEADTSGLRGGNSIHVQDASGVVIQQDASGATQNVTISISATDIAPALATFAEWARPLLAGTDRRDFDADVRAIESQLTKSRPSSVVLRECGVSLRALTENIVAGAATPPIVAAASTLWAALGLG